MIEEAAGTRLYESKKESAQRTIEKKDAKLREIDSVMYFSCLDIIIRVTRAHHSQRPENGIVAVAELPYSMASAMQSDMRINLSCIQLQQS